MNLVKTFLPALSPGWWRAAAREYGNLRSLCMGALFVALHVVLSLLYIPVAENLRVQVTFLADALCMLVCGPLVGISAGIAADLIGFLLNPSYGFFPGYTLSCVLGYVIFGLLLYRRQITVLRLFIARAIISFGVNVGLGSLWSAMLMGKGYLYYMATSLVKNALLLLPETLLLFLLLRLLLPVMSGLRLIPLQSRIPFFGKRGVEV